MCGIGGIAYWDGRPTIGEAAVELLKRQSHRGPDGEGCWRGDGVLLAHNRLAIIDLDAGKQPMLTEDGNFIIVYNGELYNFRELREQLEGYGYTFRTNSDTEVILKSYAHWKQESLNYFRGMFAFAIWDRSAKTLFIARDRVGIKPLYFYRGKDFFAFSSELQGLLSFRDIPRKIDYQAIDLYLHYQYVPAPLSVFSGICKLLPAHYLLVSSKNPRNEPISYWDIDFTSDVSRSADAWLEALDNEIGESVKMHLVSDVPFGAFLSGGIDSSTVAYHMSRHLDMPVKTFTIGFDEASYDERIYAEKVAGSIGAEHHVETIRSDSFDLLDDLIFKLVKHYGEPFADSSAIPTYFVSKLASSQVKMVLSGDGGDELFAGYNTYPNILGSTNGKVSRWDRLMGMICANYKRDELMRNAKRPPYPEAFRRHGIFYAYFKDDERRMLYKPEIADAIARENSAAFFQDIFYRKNAKDTLSALQYLDIKTYLPCDILTKVDIASMMHSLEVRVPLLDHKVMELAARVPADLKLAKSNNGEIQKKYIFKKYADRLYPGGYFDRPKQGFGVPIDSWFGGRLYQKVAERITGDEGVLLHLFNRNSLFDLVSTPEKARNNAPRIWALLFLQAWAEVFGITGHGG